MQSSYPCSFADWLFQSCLSKGFWSLQDQTAQVERKSKHSTPQHRLGKKAVPHELISKAILNPLSLNLRYIKITKESSNIFQGS